jgi:hypothetical protein
MINANGSDLKSTYVYGEVSYSTTSAAPKNTSNIQGTPKLTTPFSSSVPTVSDPSWGAPGLYTSYTGATASAGFNTTGTNKANIKITGDLVLLSGKSIVFGAGNSNITNYTVWVTGKVNVMSGASISQDAGVTVTWYVDNSILVAAGGYSNGSGNASSVSFIGVAPNSPNSTEVSPAATTFAVTGSGNFVGTIEAPGYAGTISGSGSLAGGIIANTLTISGGASFHYDDALANGIGGTNPVIGNYAFASWFEDNSAPNHKDVKQNYVVY